MPVSTPIVTVPFPVISDRDCAIADDAPKHTTDAKDAASANRLNSFVNMISSSFFVQARSLLRFDFSSRGVF
jgi:hypothetical protein